MPESPYACQVLVAGSGPAGLAAACTAAAAGMSVSLAFDAPWLGGQIWQHLEGDHPLPEARSWFDRVRSSNIRLFPATSIIAAPRPGVLLAEQTLTPTPTSRSPAGPPDTRPLELHYQKLILATGARELFLPFPGWTLPGVMGPGGAQAMVKHGWPVAGRRVLVAGSGPLLLAVADGLREHGARVVGVLEQAPISRLAAFGFELLAHPAKLLQGAGIRFRLRNTPFLFGAWVSRAQGEGCVQSVTLTNGAKKWDVPCDLLACGYGLVPNTELAQALGCGLQNHCVQVNTVQATTVDHVYAAGEITGVGGADRALLEGEIAGYAAAGNFAAAQTLARARPRWEHFRAGLDEAYRLRPELLHLGTPDTIVCRCEDVTLERLRQFSSWREAKLHSRCGMGPCQGRVCGAATRELFGWRAESVRPPLLPCRVGSLAGGS